MLVVSDDVGAEQRPGVGPQFVSELAPPAVSRFEVCHLRVQLSKILDTQSTDKSSYPDLI